MTRARILETIRTAERGSPELLDAIDKVNRADLSGRDEELVEKADKIIRTWGEGLRECALEARAA